MAAATGLSGSAAIVTLAALVALSSVAMGYLLGRKDGRVEKSTATLIFRVADELVQYGAFTRLLRDQGSRIIDSTSGAATMIVAGLTEVEAAVNRIRMEIDHPATGGPAELGVLLDAIDALVLGMLGHLQFQDLTQQQITFVSRLSLMLDEHMGQLSRQLDERGVMDRVSRFRDLFDQALGDCVMDSQRDDHHAASGLAIREAGAPELEMF